jgi:hypothetical protein
MAEREGAGNEGYGDWRSLELAIKDAAKTTVRRIMVSACYLGRAPSRGSLLGEPGPFTLTDLVTGEILRMVGVSGWGGHAMTEMGGPVSGPCHERLVFSWTGVLLREETIEDFRIQVGEHVTVEEKANGRFRVTVPREGATRSGWVPPGSVDEVLCAAIDRYLLDRPNISWGSGGTWRNRGRARQDFNLREDDEILKAGTALRVPGEAYDPGAEEWDVYLENLGSRRVPRSKVQLVTREDGQPRRTEARGGESYFEGTLREDHAIPGATISVVAGDEIQCQPSPRTSGAYLISKPDTPGSAEVPGSMVEMDLTLPPHTGEVELLCYELAPYAAALARLRPGFVAAANSRSASSAGGSEYWAGTLGTAFGTRKILRTDLSALRLQRGDVVAFYAKGIKKDEDTSTHMAVAAGDRQDVYSLWNRPRYYPVRVSTIPCASASPTCGTARPTCQRSTLRPPPPPGTPDGCPGLAYPTRTRSPLGPQTGRGVARPRPPASRRKWSRSAGRTFLRVKAEGLLACDFFTVSNATAGRAASPAPI